MSLLLDHGHPHARRYPLGLLFEECQLVNERVNRLLGSQAALNQMAVSTVPTMGAKPEATRAAGERFTSFIRKLIGEP